MVLNQISASTYGQIGKSADVSKYVMGGRGRDELEEGKPTWINELEVEFREEEEREEEVRRGKEVRTLRSNFPRQLLDQGLGLIVPELYLLICRSRMSTVNKISANTFQQIGNSRTEGYVMQPSK